MFRSLYYLFLSGLTTLALLTACEPAEPKTRLDFVTGTDLTSGNRTVTAGEIITSSFYARSTSDNNKFKRFVATRVYDTITNEALTYLDTLLNTEEFALTFVFGSRSQNNGQARGREFWRFALTDEQGKVYEKQYTLLSNFPDFNQPIHSFSSVYFHRNARENIRYLSTSQGLAFPGYLKNHPAIQPHLDFYFSEAPKLTLNLFGLNGTEFKATNLTPDDFTAAVNPNMLAAHYNNADTATSDRSAVRKDEIIAFKTGKGKNGLIQIGTFEVVRDSLRKENILRRVSYNVKVSR